MVWGANFAVRRSAVERIGPFDERIVRPHGDEEEWLAATARGGRADRVPRRAPGSTTAAPPRTRACARWPAPPSSAAGGARSATAAAGGARARRASCACWPAAAGTRCGAPARRGW